LFLLDDMVVNHIVEALQYCKDPRCFVPINSNVVLWRRDGEAHILVKMDEIFWQCDCCFPALDRSWLCGHSRALEHLIAHGTIQLNQAEHSSTLADRLVCESDPLKTWR